MKARQSLLDWAMNRQTTETKAYISTQERLFHKTKTTERDGQDEYTRCVDQSKERIINGRFNEIL